MKFLLLFISLLFFSCSNNPASSSPVSDSQSKNIQLYFGENNNQQEYVIEDPNQFPLYLKFKTAHISSIEIDDSSEKGLKCTPDILPSPSRLAAFKTDPEQNISELALRIKAPCAAYHGKLKIRITITSDSKSGSKTEFREFLLPVHVSSKEPGYFKSGEGYSGKS